jgi:hypothetical protein
MQRIQIFLGLRNQRLSRRFGRQATLFAMLPCFVVQQSRACILRIHKQSMEGIKMTIGGKRDGAGRPAPLGRKETCAVRLTPDVAEFCRQHPDGFPVLEEKLRKSKEFREWLAGRQPRSE